LVKRNKFKNILNIFTMDDSFVIQTTSSSSTNILEQSLHQILLVLIFIVIILTFTIKVSAQDLDPRAYARAPVDATVLIAGFNYTYGSVILDPTLPIKDLEAKVESPMLGVARTFSLFGMTSQAYAVLPYSWAQASGKVFGEDSSITRSGFGDTRFRLSVLFLGAPAVTVEEFAKSSPQTVLGASLTVTAPTGQFFSDKLINLGTNRWSFKPEIGLSYLVTKQWYIDLYAGVWFFTVNNSFFPGNNSRSQDPLLTFQTHVSYNINPLMWAAIDFTYYTGGRSSVNDVYNDDRQNNSRVGATFNFPISRHSAIKLAYSTGAVIRIGGNFSTISVAFQTAFF
jgi:hypothetical protein